MFIHSNTFCGYTAKEIKLMAKKAQKYDEVQRSNAKLLDALIQAKNYMACGHFVLMKHAPNSSWSSGFERQMGVVKTAIAEAQNTLKDWL